MLRLDVGSLFLFLDSLLGRLLGSMQSPIANFARVINQIAEKNGGSAEA